MNNLEKYILDRLEAKSNDNYLWPRWPAANEAAQAALEFFGKAAMDSSGDFSYAMWLAEQEAE